MKLDKSEDDGISKREHLQQVEKQTGVKPEELKGPEFPIHLSYIWSAFFKLSGSRSAGFSSVNPLTYTEIKNYCDMMGEELTGWEIDVIKRLDIEYLRSA